MKYIFLLFLNTSGFSAENLWESFHFPQQKELITHSFSKEDSFVLKDILKKLVKNLYETETKEHEWLLNKNRTEITDIINGNLDKDLINLRVHNLETFTESALCFIVLEKNIKNLKTFNTLEEIKKNLKQNEKYIFIKEILKKIGYTETEINISPFREEFSQTHPLIDIQKITKERLCKTANDICIYLNKNKNFDFYNTKFFTSEYNESLEFHTTSKFAKKTEKEVEEEKYYSLIDSFLDEIKLISEANNNQFLYELFTNMINHNYDIFNNPNQGIKIFIDYFMKISNKNTEELYSQWDKTSSNKIRGKSIFDYLSIKRYVFSFLEKSPSDMLKGINSLPIDKENLNIWREFLKKTLEKQNPEYYSVIQYITYNLKDKNMFCFLMNFILKNQSLLQDEKEEVVIKILMDISKLSLPISFSYINVFKEFLKSHKEYPSTITNIVKKSKNKDLYYIMLDHIMENKEYFKENEQCVTTIIEKMSDSDSYISTPYKYWNFITDNFPNIQSSNLNFYWSMGNIKECHQNFKKSDENQKAFLDILDHILFYWFQDYGYFEEDFYENVIKGKKYKKYISKMTQWPIDNKNVLKAMDLQTFNKEHDEKVLYCIFSAFNYLLPQLIDEDLSDAVFFYVFKYCNEQKEMYFFLKDLFLSLPIHKDTIKPFFQEIMNFNEITPEDLGSFIEKAKKNLDQETMMFLYFKVLSKFKKNALKTYNFLSIILNYFKDDTFKNEIKKILFSNMDALEESLEKAIKKEDFNQFNKILKEYTPNITRIKKYEKIIKDILALPPAYEKGMAINEFIKFIYRAKDGVVDFTPITKEINDTTRCVIENNLKYLNDNLLLQTLDLASVLGEFNLLKSILNYISYNNKKFPNNKIFDTIKDTSFLYDAIKKDSEKQEKYAKTLNFLFLFLEKNRIFLPKNLFESMENRHTLILVPFIEKHFKNFISVFEGCLEKVFKIAFINKKDNITQEILETYINRLNDAAVHGHDDIVENILKNIQTQKISDDRLVDIIKKTLKLYNNLISDPTKKENYINTLDCLFSFAQKNKTTIPNKVFNDLKNISDLLFLALKQKKDNITQEIIINEFQNCEVQNLIKNNLTTYQKHPEHYEKQLCFILKIAKEHDDFHGIIYQNMKGFLNKKNKDFIQRNIQVFNFLLERYCYRYDLSIKEDRLSFVFSFKNLILDQKKFNNFIMDNFNKTKQNSKYYTVLNKLISAGEKYNVNCKEGFLYIAKNYDHIKKEIKFKEEILTECLNLKEQKADLKVLDLTLMGNPSKDFFNILVETFLERKLRLYNGEPYTDMLSKLYEYSIQKSLLNGQNYKNLRETLGKNKVDLSNTDATHTASNSKEVKDIRKELEKKHNDLEKMGRDKIPTLITTLLEETLLETSYLFSPLEDFASKSLILDKIVIRENNVEVAVPVKRREMMKVLYDNYKDNTNKNKSNISQMFLSYVFENWVANYVSKWSFEEQNALLYVLKNTPAEYLNTSINPFAGHGSCTMGNETRTLELMDNVFENRLYEPSTTCDFSEQVYKAYWAVITKCFMAYKFLCIKTEIVGRTTLVREINAYINKNTPQEILKLHKKLKNSYFLPNLRGLDPKTVEKEQQMLDDIDFELECRRSHSDHENE